MTAPSNTSVVPISWDTIHSDSPHPCGVVTGAPTTACLARYCRCDPGRLGPRCILARELDIRPIDTVCVASYEDKTAGPNPKPVEILKPPEHALKNYGEGWLLIDDIVDTGATVRAVRKLLPKAFFATLYARSKTKGLVDLYLHEAGPDVWIDFPWER